MTAIIRSLFLAALLAAGTAYAQQQTDNPDNPHSTKAKDKQSSDVPSSTTNQQVQQGETANPHSVYNAKDDSKPRGNANIEPAEKQNPHNPNETWNSTGRSNSRDTASANSGMSDMDHGQMDHGAMMKNATPQQMLQRLHMSNQHEIQMAQMAQQNGTEKVKSYAQTLQQDHQAAEQKVKDLAKKKNVTLSDTPRDPQMQQRMQAMNDRFQSLKGQQFDRAFTNAMSMEHHRMIEMAQAWKQNCQDQEVCNLLDTLLPKLQQHEQMANSLRAPAAQGRAPDSSR